MKYNESGPYDSCAVIPSFLKPYSTCLPVAQTVQHGARNAKVMGLVTREGREKLIKCVLWDKRICQMHILK